MSILVRHIFIPPYDIHGHTQLPGDHLGHLGVHPLTHLDPTVGNGYASVVVVDGYVHCVPEEKEVELYVALFLLKFHLVPN